MDHVDIVVKDHFDELVKLKIWDTCKLNVFWYFLYKNMKNDVNGFEKPIFLQISVLQINLKNYVFSIFHDLFIILPKIWSNHPHY